MRDTKKFSGLRGACLSESEAGLFVSEFFVESVCVDPFFVAGHFYHHAPLLPKAAFSFIHERSADTLPVRRAVHDEIGNPANRTSAMDDRCDVQREQSDDPAVTFSDESAFSPREIILQPVAQYLAFDGISKFVEQREELWQVAR
jgi:hypothetical protein